MNKCFKVRLNGLGILKYTTSGGNRKIKKYPTKRGAEKRLNLEKTRGWKGKVLKCSE